MNKKESNDNDDNGVAWRCVGGAGYKKCIKRKEQCQC